MATELATRPVIHLKLVLRERMNRARLAARAQNRSPQP
jgi:hypothetical protein